MTDGQIPASQDEIEKAEAEIRAKEAEQEKLRTEEYKKMLDKAEKEGADKALKEYQADQERKRLLEENKKLQDMVKASQLAAEAKIKEMADKMELRMQEIESKSKGIARNDSPFPTTTEPNTQMTPEKIRAIDEASLRAFEKEQNIKFT